ncbi:MAG: PfkB family carbohydrate kinase [Alkalispirochaeta sp.]
MFKMKSDARYALVVPTSMGVRITPVNGQPTHSSTMFEMQATSAETNVASVTSYLGLPTKVLTAFVEASPIARFIKDNLAARHMDYEGPERPQGGPWGYRHQFNIADSGYGSRGPRVHNDRAGEVGRTLTTDDFDLKRLFETDGVQVLHLSGLVAALSTETGRFCLELARQARASGTVVSFDLNYRASFWVNREEELRHVFHEIASISDILVGNEEDFQLSLGLDGPPPGGSGLEGKMESFKGMIKTVRAAYPGVKICATTLREVVSTNHHLWGAILSVEDQWYTAAPRDITVLDRIGGGDGFVGGMLYAILRGWKPETWVQFGWATGAMATTFTTDYAQPLDEGQVWAMWHGNARVAR